ncbi:C2H2-type domain-containing protein [Trichostrongylus colubriformis]|uniref:C2H2-type domain-containing protein n=1 Tax=Trichostrongylus colubriformis TaxID=6319 RepID=A0AAN8FCU3_TRICO
MEEAVTKKARVWNPAVDNDAIKDKLRSSQDQTSNDMAVDFTGASNPSLPLLIQNYFHLARVQQQRVVEEAIRRGFTQPFPVQTMSMMARNTALTAAMPPQQAIASFMPSSTASSSAISTSITTNPLVQTALGVTAIANENCCAICGSAFRLTADLVQHMRNNHRRTRFKRKNEKTFV